jgi:2-oxo-3-hexenedioate decarboxylase
MIGALDSALFVVPPSERESNLDFSMAYRVAAETTRIRRARGEKSIGRKIGYTNQDMWKRFGVNQPIWSYVYQHTVQFADSGVAAQSLSGMVSPRIEPEIAFRLSAPLDTGCRDPAAVIARLEWVAPAFEIVDSHYRDWKFTGPDSVIDFGHHAALILGAPCEIRRSDISSLTQSLSECRVSLTRNSADFDSGLGRNALGHPAIAIAHLADVLASQQDELPLSPGEIITTGTLTLAHSIVPGETWRSQFVGLDLAPLVATFE